MPLNPAPIQQTLTTPTGLVNTIWAKWFDFVRILMHRAPTYTVAQLPSRAEAGDMAFVSDETGGAVLAFYDGTNWRRCTDRNVVS
jgi:hypothetical protein